MTTLARIREVLKNNEEYLKGLGFTEVGVFGSYVRGEATPESDVDILLGSDTGQEDTCWDELAIYDTLSEQLNNAEIDIAMKGRLFPKLREYILAEVEYVVGPPEVMAHNATRKVGMKRQKDYTLYLDQMIDEMEWAMKDLAGNPFEEFRKDERQVRAGRECVHVIGGRINKIPHEIKEKYAHLEIPWKDMREKINKIVHDDKLPVSAIWEIITEDVPKYLPKIQEMRRLEELRMKKVRIKEERERDGLKG